jgi:hypothetical protein
MFIHIGWSRKSDEKTSCPFHVLDSHVPILMPGEPLDHRLKVDGIGNDDVVREGG